MTSDDLRRDLRDIDRLVAVLGTPGYIDVDDMDDLRWLVAQRRSLLDILAARRAQEGNKVVSLALWRYGRDVRGYAAAPR